LGSFLLNRGVWVECQGSDTSISGRLDNFLLGFCGSDLALRVSSSFDGALLLELLDVAGRHVADVGDAPLLVASPNGKLTEGLSWIGGFGGRAKGFATTIGRLGAA
jgi:hypothetical protein